MKERDNGNRISSYALAAVLTAARLFSLSLYVPREGENAALTALTAAALCLLKLPLFFLLAWLSRRFGSTTGFKAALAGISAVMIPICAEAFSEMAVSAYPERCTKLTTFIVLIPICAYVASMGVTGTARTASLSLAGFAAVCIPVFLEMRGSMLTDRIDLFSYAPAAEITHTAAAMLSLFCEPVIFAGSLSSAKGSPRTAARVYLIADALVSGVFFLMCAAVTGRFFGSSGYAFFALSYNTRGAFIDRANGIFTFFSSVFTILTVSALMLVVRRAFDDGGRRQGKEQSE